MKKKQNLQKQQPVSSKKRLGKAVVAKRKYLIPLIVIVLISLIVFLPVFHNGFVNLDDDKYIQENPMLAAFNLKEIFSHYVMGNYHPLTMLTYSIEYSLFGLNAQGYHAINLFLHLFNVILVFYVVLYLSDKKEVALVASLLFGIHPLHVESVAWASELKDLLYTFFFLAGWICYLRYIKGAGKRFYMYCLLLFLLSLLSKAMAASLPVVLLLTDYFKGRKLNAKIWLEKIPFFALAFLFGVIAVSAQKSLGAIQDVDVLPFFQRMVFACYSFITYLYKLLIPVHLSAFYPYPIKDGESIPAGFYIYVGLFFALVAAVVYSLRFSRKVLFGIGFFAITVFLVLQLLPVGDAIMADRYTYIPSIGFFFLAGEGFYRLWARKYQMADLKLPVTILLGIIIIFFSVQTYTRCAVWENGMALWNDVIKKYQTIPVAYNNRGLLLKSQNKIQEALNDYNKAIELQPNYAFTYNNRGILLAGEKRNKEALNDYNKAIELRPDFAEAYNNRGLLQMNNQKYQEALNDFNKAIELNPDFKETYKNRNMLQMSQSGPDALSNYNKAIEQRPDDPDLYQNRGVFLASQNKYKEALNDYNKAIELRPNFPEAYNNRGMLLMNNQKNQEALSDFNRALNLKPDYAIVYNNLGNLFLATQKYDQALQNYNKAIELQPTYAKAYNGLGVLLMRQQKNEQAINAYNKALEIQPDYVEAYCNRAIAEINSGKKDAACMDLKQALNLGYQPATDLQKQWGCH